MVTLCRAAGGVRSGVRGRAVWPFGLLGTIALFSMSGVNTIVSAWIKTLSGANPGL